MSLRRTTPANNRLIKIDEKLSNGKYITRENLFIYLNSGIDGISIETLDKDIRLIRETLEDNFPHVKLLSDHRRGYHYSINNFTLFTKEIYEEDKNLLMLAGSLFEIFKGTPLTEKFNETIEKVLEQSIVKKTFNDSNGISHLQIETSHSLNSNKWIPTILEAIQSKSSLKMNYKGYGKDEKTKHISPYILKQYKNRWYMVAYDYNCEREQKSNVFSLDCILNLERSNKPYHLDRYFNADDFFNYSIGVWHFYKEEPIKVQLEFLKNKEMIMSIPIHHSQKIISQHSDQKLVIEIEVYNSPELEQLILSFGSTVKVVSPKIVADKIEAVTKEMLQLYY